MKKITETEVYEYLNALERGEKLTNSWSKIGIISELYRSLQVAMLLTLHDTMSDEFQIVSEMMNIVWNYAERRKSTE